MPRFQLTRPIAWGAKVSPNFKERVLQLCENLGWWEDSPSDLMSCMAFETGMTFSPAVRNYGGSSGTGLIQFMDATARGLGTTTEVLALMSAVRQLDYVEAYFLPQAKRIRSLEDLYMAILWPRGIAQPLEYVLWKTGTRAYLANRGLDRNKDGVITKLEATSKVREMRKIGLGPGYAG